MKNQKGIVEVVNGQIVDGTKKESDGSFRDFLPIGAFGLIACGTVLSLAALCTVKTETNGTFNQKNEDKYTSTILNDKDLYAVVYDNGNVDICYKKHNDTFDIDEYYKIKNDQKLIINSNREYKVLKLEDEYYNDENDINKVKKLVR